jgi:hypothetical protein
MKAYKYNRYKQGPQFSMQSLSVNEKVIYIPELKKMLFQGYDGYHMESYFGVCKSDLEAQFITEAEEYMSDIKNHIIPKYISSTESKDEPFKVNIDAYSTIPGKQTKASDQKFFVKIISEKKPEEPTIPPAGSSNSSFIQSSPYGDLTLSNYEEVELDITLEDIQKIEKFEQDIKDIELARDNYKIKIFGNTK